MAEAVGTHAVQHFRIFVNHVVQFQRSELHNCTMLFDGRYKWIRSYNDTDELYDLETDPQELHNVIDEYPEVLDRMRPYSFRH